MRKILTLFVIAMALMGCGALLKVPVTEINGNLSNYNYVYIIPTAPLTSSSGISGGQYGVYGGTTKTINPADVIAGEMMKKGFTVLPEIREEFKNKTIVVSYGETGIRYLWGGLLGYSKEVIIQFRDAVTSELIVSSQAEGVGSTESDDIREALIRAIDAIFKDL